MGARLAAYLSYRDAPAALGVARGDRLRRGPPRRCRGRDGRARRGAVRRRRTHGRQLRRRLPASAPGGRLDGGGLYLVLDDAAAVDDRFARGTAADGTPVIAPEDTGWGTRRARLLDPEGGEWSFGTYAPGQAW